MRKHTLAQSAQLLAAGKVSCTDADLMPSLRHETALVTAMGGFTTACRQKTAARKQYPPIA
jgi:hypothetical protein